MSEEKKSLKPIITLLLGVIGIPFLITLTKFFKKGPDEPVLMQDLLAIFGLQVLAAVAIMVYVLFFHHATVVLG